MNMNPSNSPIFMQHYYPQSTVSLLFHICFHQQGTQQADVFNMPTMVSHYCPIALYQPTNVAVDVTNKLPMTNVICMSSVSGVKLNVGSRPIHNMQ